MNYLRNIFTVLIAGLAMQSLAETKYSIVSIKLGGSEYAPVAGDFDGDGKQDPAVYQETTANWFIALSSNRYVVGSVNLGGPGYIPVDGDFDADGKSDPAVYQETTGNWYVMLSASYYAIACMPAFGQPGYLPVPGDYDGTGETELAVYQQASGNWYVLRGEPVEVTDSNVMAVMYANAMVNASNVVASKIRRDLTSISDDNPNLVWRVNPTTGAREVLVASFMKASIATANYHVGQSTLMKYGDSWVTLVPELKNVCRNYTGTNIILRMKQVLGLPLTSANDTVVEYYVDPALCLFRPSRDPEVTDHEAEVAFRAGTPYVGAVSTNYTGWFQRTAESRNYGMTNGVWNAYPWTQLGYTYDWAKTGSDVMGLSEFVLPAQMLFNEYGVTALVYVVTVTNALNYATSPDNRAIAPRGAAIIVAAPEDQ